MFKVGDKVEAVECGSNAVGPRNGEQFVIQSIEDYLGYSKYLRSSDEYDYCFGYELKLVEDSESHPEDPTQSDVINQPAHYTQGKIEVIDFIEDQKLDFRLANVVNG